MNAGALRGSAVPRVSVVTPFFNAEPFLAEAIESVRAQSFEDWELILVDDGSADAGPEIADRFARQCPDRIRRLEHPGRVNRGTCASLNLGIRESRGALLALLDADDVWFPEKLGEQVASLAAHPEVAMVYGPSRWWYSWTGRLEDVDRDFQEPLGVSPERVVSSPELLIGMLNGSVPAATPSAVLLRRKAVESVGAFEPSLPNSHSDYSFYAKLFLEHDVFASGKSSVKYRQHPDSTLTRAKRTGAHDRDRWRVLQWFAGYLEKNGGGDARVRAVLGAQLAEYRYRTGNRLERFVRDPKRAVKSVVTRWSRARGLDADRPRRSPAIKGGEGR